VVKLRLLREADRANGGWLRDLGSNFVIPKIVSLKSSAAFVFSQLQNQPNGVSREKPNAKNLKLAPQIEPSKPAIKSNHRKHRNANY
jgi:hypothetical protein